MYKLFMFLEGHVIVFLSYVSTVVVLKKGTTAADNNVITRHSLRAIAFDYLIAP